MADSSKFIYQQTHTSPSNITLSQDDDGLCSQLSRNWNRPSILPNNQVALTSETADGYRKVVSLSSIRGNCDSLALQQTVCAKVARHPLLVDLLASTSNVNCTKQGSTPQEQISEPFSCHTAKPSVASQQASMVPTIQSPLQNKGLPPPYHFTASYPNDLVLADAGLSACQQPINGGGSSQGAMNVQPSQVQNFYGSPLRRINGQTYIFQKGTWFRFPQQGSISRPAVQQHLAANNGSHLKQVSNCNQQNLRAQPYPYTSQVVSSSSHTVAVAKQNSSALDRIPQQLQPCTEKQNGLPQSCALYQQSSATSSANYAQTFGQPSSSFFVNGPNQKVPPPSEQHNISQIGMQQHLGPDTQHPTGWHMTEGLQGNAQTNWSANDTGSSRPVGRNIVTAEPNWNKTNGFFAPTTLHSHMQQPSAPCSVMNSCTGNRNKACSNLPWKEGAHQLSAYSYSHQNTPALHLASNNLNECSVKLNSQNNSLTVSQRVAASEDFLVVKNAMKNPCDTFIRSTNFQHPSVPQQCNNLNSVTSLGNQRSNPLHSTFRTETCQSEGEPQLDSAFPQAQASVCDKPSTSGVVYQQIHNHPTLLALQNAANDILSRGQMNDFATRLGRSPKNGHLEGEKVNYSFPLLNNFASVSFSATEQQLQQNSSPSSSNLNLLGASQQSIHVNPLVPPIPRQQVEPNVTSKSTAKLPSKENLVVIEDLLDSSLSRQNMTSAPLRMPLHNAPLQKQNSWLQSCPKSFDVNEQNILSTDSNNQVLQPSCKTLEVKQEARDVSKIHSCSLSNQSNKDTAPAKQSDQSTTSQSMFPFPSEWEKGIEEAIMAIFRADPSFFMSQLAKSVQVPSKETSKILDSRTIGSLVCHQSDHSMLSVSSLPPAAGVLENKARGSIEEPTPCAAVATAGIVSQDSGVVNVCRLQKGNQPQVAVVPPIILPSVKHSKLSDNEEGDSVIGNGKKCSRLMEDLKNISLVVVNVADQPISFKNNSDALSGGASVDGMATKATYRVDRSLVLNTDKNIAEVVKDSSVNASKIPFSINMVNAAYKNGNAVIKEELVQNMTDGSGENTTSITLSSPDEDVELDLSFGISGVCSLAEEDFGSLDDKKLIELSACMKNPNGASQNGNALLQSKQEALHQDELGIKDEVYDGEGKLPLSSDLPAVKPVQGLSADVPAAKPAHGGLSADVPSAKPAHSLSESLERSSDGLANAACSDSEHLVKSINSIPFKSQKEEKRFAPQKILSENTEAILTFWNPEDFNELDVSNECETGQQFFDQRGIHQKEANSTADEHSYSCTFFSLLDEAGSRAFSDASASAIGSQLPELCEEFPFGVENRKTIVTRKTADKSEQTTDYFPSVSHTKVALSDTSVSILEQTMNVVTPCSNQSEVEGAVNKMEPCMTSTSEDTATPRKLSEMTASYEAASAISSYIEEEVSDFITDSEVEVVTTSSADDLEQINTEIVSRSNHAVAECTASLNAGPEQCAEEIMNPEVMTTNSSFSFSGKIAPPGPEDQLEVKSVTSGLLSSIVDQAVKGCVPSKYQSSVVGEKDTKESEKKDSKEGGMHQPLEREDLLNRVTITVLDTTKINTFSATCNVLANDSKADVKKILTNKQKCPDTDSMDLCNSSNNEEQKCSAKSVKNETLDEDKAQQTYCCMYGWLLNVYGNGPGCSCEVKNTSEIINSSKGCISGPDQNFMTNKSVEITEKTSTFNGSQSSTMPTFCKQADLQNCIKAAASTGQNLKHKNDCMKKSHSDKKKKKMHKVSKHQSVKYKTEHQLGLDSDGYKRSYDKSNADETVLTQCGNNVMVNELFRAGKPTKDLSKRSMSPSSSELHEFKWKCLTKTDGTTKANPKIEILPSKSISLESVKLNLHAFKVHKQLLDHCDEKQRKPTKSDSFEKLPISPSKFSSIISCKNKCRKEMSTEKLSVNSVKAVPTSVKPLKCSSEKDFENTCIKAPSTEKQCLNAHFAIKAESASVKPFRFSSVKCCEIKCKKEVSTEEKSVSVPFAVKVESAACSKSVSNICHNLKNQPDTESKPKKIITLQQYLERKKNNVNEGDATTASESKVPTAKESSVVKRSSEQQSCPSLDEHNVSKRCKLSSQPAHGGKLNSQPRHNGGKLCIADSHSKPKIKLQVYSQTVDTDKHCKVGSRSMTPIATFRNPLTQTRSVSQNLNRENHTKTVIESRYKSSSQLKSRLWYSNIADKIKKKCKDASGPAKRLPVNKTWSSVNSERKKLRNTVAESCYKTERKNKSTKEFSRASQEKVENCKLFLEKNNCVIPRMIAFHLWPDTVVLTESTEDVKISSERDSQPPVGAVQPTLTSSSFQEAISSTENEAQSLVPDGKKSKEVFQKYKDMYLARSNSK